METAAAPPAATCPECRAPRKLGARFCGSCGARFPAERVKLKPVAISVLVVAVVAALAAGYLDLRGNIASEADERPSEFAELRTKLAALDSEVEALSSQTGALSSEFGEARRKQEAGLAPLANEVLRSVFTLETLFGGGSGWAAWVEDGSTFVVTAHHVVEGFDRVKVRWKTSTWTGLVIRIDEVNDVALVRVGKEIAPALWPDPTKVVAPMPGDELLLIGSPYGLEGTVTTGIVSRVTYNRIQTDAAANPGNSGGPAVDVTGDVVGIVVAGGGQNLNFAVPIQRLCVKLRRC